MRAIISAGGTGGHLYPALAVAETLATRDSDADIIVITGMGELESELVKKTGFRLVRMDVPGLRRKLSPELFSAVYKMGRGVTNAARVIRKYEPDVVAGFGGAITYPVIRGAQKLGVPTLIHEQNIVPGLANKHLSRLADIVAVSVEETAAFLPRAGRVIVTGTPIRISHLNEKRETARLKLELPLSGHVVTVFGGSQGARRVNEAAAAAYQDLAEVSGLEVIHLTGNRDYTEIAKTWSANGAPPNVKLLPYLDDMGWAYRATDLIVCRAGASTLAELGAYGLPAVLVPYPYASNDHQAKNAAALAARGAAVVIVDAELTPERLGRTIRELINDKTALTKMAGKMRSTGRPDAAGEVAELVESLAFRRHDGMR